MSKKKRRYAYKKLIAEFIGTAIVAAITGNTAPIACVWVFIVGPFIGATLAALVYKYLENEKN